MNIHHGMAVVVALSLCAFTVSRADDAPDGPPIEKHKVGHYQLEARGMPANVYVGFIEALGGSAKPEVVRGVRSGKIEWITEKEGVGEQYEVVVPPSYKPGVAHGVLVYINGGGTSGLLPAHYHPLLEKHRLIAIGANNSGNDRDVIARHALAVAAVDLLRERYDLDEDRIYISGISGGGRVASQVMIIRADLFDGGIPYVGANPAIAMPTADSKGNTYNSPGSWRRPDQRILREAGVNGRYVFMTGSTDFNKAGVKAVYEGYKGKGFKHVEYIEQAGLGHSHPDAAHYEKAIVFLDAPLLEAAADDYAKAQRFDKAGRKDQALALYRKSAAHAGDADWRGDAEAKAAELGKEYEAVMKSIDDAIAAQDRAAFQQAIGALRKDWRAMTDRDTFKELADRFFAAGESDDPE